MGLDSRWTSCSNLLNSTKSDLEKQVDSWNQYEGCFNDLSRWLREMEPEARVQHPKSTLEEKKAQLEALKVYSFINC